MEGYISALYAQRAAEEAGQLQATEATIARYKEAQRQAKLSAEKHLQSADIQRQLNLRDANQLLAARGQTGGLAETNTIRNQSRYENTANSIRSDLDGSIRETDLRIAEEEAAGRARLQEIASRYTVAIAQLVAAAQASAKSKTSSGSSRVSGTKKTQSAAVKTKSNTLFGGGGGFSGGFSGGGSFSSGGFSGGGGGGGGISSW